MSLNPLLSFLRKTPTLDFLLLFITWYIMYRSWRAAKYDPKEENADTRQAGASAITNQVNGTLTAASIILAAVGAVLVVGGGISGIQASLDLADIGFKVYLVEKSPTIGGKMAQLDKTFPTMDCSL